MRPLKSFAPAAALPLLLVLAGAACGAASATAAPATVETHLRQVLSSGTPAADFRGTSPQVSSLSAVTSFRSSGLLGDSLVLTASVTEAKNDYSATFLTDAEGARTALSERFHGAETSAETGLEWKAGANTARLSLGGMITPSSPYPYQAASLGESYSFFEGATVAGADLHWTKQRQPASFFTDPRDFQVRKRPGELRSERLELWVEQLLTDRWKSQLRLLGGERLEDRPPHLGVEARNAYALSSRASLRLDAGAIRELRNRALRDERGYYGVNWAELQGTYEAFYDFLVTAALGTTVERETVPWSGVRTQVGTDTFGLKAAYKSRRWSASLGWLQSVSNTSYRSQSFEGDFQWEL